MRAVFPTESCGRSKNTTRWRRQTLSNLAAYVTEIVRKGVDD